MNEGGLFWGVDVKLVRRARQVREPLQGLGVLAQDTHGKAIRLAPPLVMPKEEIDFAVAQLAAVV